MIAAAESTSGGLGLLLIVLPLLLLGALVAGFFYLRPRLRERRHQAWKEAGLLPEQLDPDGHDRPVPD